MKNGHVDPCPEGFHTATPNLVFKDTAKALAFYEKAFGAKVRSVMKGPDGKVMHADFMIGDSILFANDEFPQQPNRSPETLGGATASLYLYVDDADAWFKRAVDAGAKSLMPVSDAFWGDRLGAVQDPFGYSWNLATHVEDVSPAESKKRQEKWFASMAGK